MLQVSKTSIYMCMSFWEKKWWMYNELCVCIQVAWTSGFNGTFCRHGCHGYWLVPSTYPWQSEAEQFNILWVFNISCNNASCAPIYCTFLNYTWSTAAVALHGLKPLVSCVSLLDFILLFSILAVLDTVEVLAEVEAVNLFIEQHKTNRCTCCTIYPDCLCLLCSDLLCKILILSEKILFMSYSYAPSIHVIMWLCNPWCSK